MEEHKEQVIGSWSCPNCECMAGTTWRGQPKDEDAPMCCGGMRMFPYRIPSQEERDIKTVSRWISDIEAEQTHQDSYWDDPLRATNRC